MRMSIVYMTVIILYISIYTESAVITERFINNITVEESPKSSYGYAQTKKKTDDETFVMSHSKFNNDSSMNIEKLTPILTHDKSFKFLSTFRKQSHDDRIYATVEKTSVDARSEDDYDGDRPSRHRSVSVVDPFSVGGDPASVDGPVEYCRRPAICERLESATCFGARLPYMSTTLQLTDLTTQREVRERLALYERSVRKVPKCWAVVRPLLCALYVPRCERDAVDLPSLDMCNVTRGPCAILHGTPLFPPELRCGGDGQLPRTACRNELREVRFDSGGRCASPLVRTDDRRTFYTGVDGCALPCNDPLYTDEERARTRTLVAWGAAVCLACTVFAAATFAIDWRGVAGRYPALGVFYANACFAVSCIGWSAQFYGGSARNDIVCRADGTPRRAEPTAGENLSCVFVFVLVYYFLIAALVWFVIVAYSWHASVRALGKIRDRVDGKAAYFHLAAWSLPLVLTITTMALGEIDGDSIGGICFVGHVSATARVLLLLVPLYAALSVGLYFLCRGIITLVQLRHDGREVISARASGKIRSTIVRTSVFSALTVAFGTITFMCHVYRFRNETNWRDSLDEYILCRIVHGGFDDDDDGHCYIAMRPNIAALQINIASLFAAGIAVSSWVWTPATRDAWVRFLRRKFDRSSMTGDGDDEPPRRLQKHKLIAQAFAKRKMLYSAGRVSISFRDAHTDPVGLDFDLNSVASRDDLSSTWARALPKLVSRRCALTGAPTGSVSSQRRNSLDSEVSFSVRRVSLESRRNSLDSQLSVQVAELKATARKVGSSSGRSRHHRSRRRAARRAATRRESSTSLESQLGARLLTALTALHPDVQSLVPNLKRRSATAGLDAQRIGELLAGGKLAPQCRHASSTEDDDDDPHERPAEEDISDATSDDECPELTRLAAVQSSLNSAVSAGARHAGSGSCDVGVQADARDIATQTLSSFELEIGELDESIDAIRNELRRASRRVSQGTQVSPVVERRSIERQFSEDSPNGSATRSAKQKHISNELKSLTEVHKKKNGTSLEVQTGLRNNRRYEESSSKAVEFELEPLRMQNDECATDDEGVLHT